MIPHDALNAHLTAILGAWRAAKQFQLAHIRDEAALPDRIVFRRAHLALHAGRVWRVHLIALQASPSIIGKHGFNTSRTAESQVSSSLNMFD